MDCTAHELALHAARQVLAKGAEDVVVLSMPEHQRGLFDYVVIATGRSERQTKTLVEEVYHFCKRHQISHFPPEGEAGWMVVDCHEVVTHAFLTEMREHYRIEELWPEATVVDVEAELQNLPDPDAA
ncbi:MAG: ribosome silencing factor [Planctomycetota bacterium]|jgi:ribosome-associated protein|nr:ribosome silencing factor [Planctomycetota bacterium]